MGCVYKGNWWLNRVSQCDLTVIGHDTTVPRSFLLGGRDCKKAVVSRCSVKFFFNVYFYIHSCCSFNNLSENAILWRRTRSSTSQSYSIFSYFKVRVW